MNQKTLAGKTALITGGSRGIGAGIARQLAMNGANVAITYLNAERKANEIVAELTSLGVQAISIQTDAARPDQMKILPKKVVGSLGSLDIVVNNADAIHPKSILEVTDEELEATVNLAIKGPYILSREAAKLMKEGGRIINIASVKGEMVGMPNISLHVMGKAAWVSFAKSWAHDLAAKGITVNAVQPGPIQTDMNPGTGANGDYNRSRTALKRYGTVNDVGHVVAFLASDEAGYITGSVITVDGGYNA